MSSLIECHLAMPLVHDWNPEEPPAAALEIVATRYFPEREAKVEHIRTGVFTLVIEGYRSMAIEFQAESSDGVHGTLRVIRTYMTEEGVGRRE